MKGFFLNDSSRVFAGVEPFRGLGLTVNRHVSSPPAPHVAQPRFECLSAAPQGQRPRPLPAELRHPGADHLRGLPDIYHVQFILRGHCRHRPEP